MTELDNRVAITVQIQDVTVTRAGFGILGIVHKHQQSGLSRVETYTDLTSLLAVFPSYTPVGRFASFAFGQGAVIAGAIPETVKVIKQEAAETATQALDAAILVDSDFYGVGGGWGDQTQIESLAAWTLANNRLGGYSTANADAITTATTDEFSVIQATTNNRAFGYYSANVGLEFATDTITVASTTATADITTFVAAHGSNPFTVGDTIGIWTSAVSALNSTWTIETVGPNDFTFTVPAGTASDVAAADCWQNFNLIEAAIMGKMLPQDAGSRTWDIQQLAGVTPDNLTGTAQTNLGGKNANWFTTVGGLNVTGGLKSGGGGGKLAGGRYIDVQRGSDWLKTNLQADLFALMVNEGGSLGYDADGFQKVEQTINTRLDDGLDKGFLTPFVSGIYAGQNYNVSMPLLGSIPTADKTARLLQGIEINALIRGKIHNLEATVTLST